MRALLSAIAALALAVPAIAQSRLPAEGFADLNERLSPAVVNIATSQRVEGVEDLPRFPPGSPMERLNEGQGEGAAQITSLGSGFIVSPDGVVVTNNHVIESADAIEVVLQNGRRYEATVVGRDPATDIAVLRVHAGQQLPYVNMGDSDTARVGDIVLAIGKPFGLGGSLSVGVVSARNRNIDAGRYNDFIQTDAAINRGEFRRGRLETAIEDDDIGERMDRCRLALLREGRNEVGPYQSPYEDGMQHFHEFYRRIMQAQP